MLQIDPQRIVKIGDAKLRLATGELRQRGIVSIEHLCFAQPDGDYRRLPLPYVTIVLTFGPTGLWRTGDSGWMRFPQAAVRGHGGRWTDGRDPPELGSEYLTVLIDPFAFAGLTGGPASLVAGRFAHLSEFPLLAPRLALRDLERLRPTERMLRVAEAMTASAELAIGGRRPTPLSDRQRRARFRAELGMSPKGWSRLIRYAALLEELHPRYAAPEIQARAEYYDQSHLIRDFRLFTGLTPGEYRRQKAGGDPRLFFYSL